MKDQFEDFVRDNSSAFDQRVPSEKMWYGIESELKGKKASGQWIWKAASFVLFVICSLLVADKFFIDNDQNIALTKQELAEDFNAIESFYFQEISQKKGLIYDYEERNVVVNQAFEQDLQKLDVMYEVLKEELQANPSKKVVDALILNLLVRVDILNKELETLENSDKEGGKEDPSGVNV